MHHMRYQSIKFIMLLPLTIMLSFCLSHARADVIDFLPASGFSPGWTFEFPAEIYYSDNLHEYINGQAELFKQYDVVEMATAAYIHNNDPALTFTIDIYEMASAMDAFGIYSIYRRPDMTFADIGEQAIISPLNVRFWQSSYYVNIVAGSLDSSLTQLILDVAGQVSAKLPTSPMPVLLDSLPDEGRIANSLRYVKSNYLGIQNVRVIEARYRQGENECTVFIAHGNVDQANLLKNQSMIRWKIIRDKIYGVREFSNTEIAEHYLNLLP